MNAAYLSYQARYVVNQFYSTVVMNLHLPVAIHSSRMTNSLHGVDLDSYKS
jgi:hypothetical protein